MNQAFISLKELLLISWEGTPRLLGGGGPLYVKILKYLYVYFI